VDEDTLQFYRRNAEAYAGWAKPPSTWLKGFLVLLPPGGSILELGCGAGNHSEEMLAAGFSVRATDGSPEMAEIASRRLGKPVDAMQFDQLDEHEAYDGVWASACLLHVPRDELSGILRRIHRALKREGLFYASFKIGEGGAGRIPRPIGSILPTPPQAHGNCSSQTPASSPASTRRRRPCGISSCARASGADLESATHVSRTLAVTE